jgi:hypothetical protein
LAVSGRCVKPPFDFPALDAQRAGERPRLLEDERHEQQTGTRAGKALLLRQIQQQRLDLIASRRDWIEATAPFDRGWLTFQHLRSGRWSAAVDGRMVRSSSALFMRWTKRGFGLEHLAHGKTPAAPDILPLNPCPSPSAIPVLCSGA